MRVEAEVSREVVLLDSEESRLVLLRDDAAVKLHERLDALALEVAEHHGEAQPEAAGEAGLLERHVRRRVDARERVVLLEEKSDGREHRNAAVLDLGLAVEREASGVDVLGEAERVEETERSRGARPFLDGRGGELRLRRRRRGRDEGGGGTGGEGERELHVLL